jgi:hypothetical protein
MSKICNKCLFEKDLDSFYKDSSGLQGRRSICKFCENEQKSTIRKTDEYKEYRRVYEQKYYFKRRKSDVSFKLKKDVSSIIRRALNGKKKGDSIWNHLPYTIEKLKSYLESQFDDNMNWDNHGIYWHIDHIQPQCSLKYDDFNHPNFLKCWSLDNLRPLKMIDNLHKSSIFNGINYRGK